MLPKGPSKKITFLESPKDFEKEVVNVDPSSASPKRKKQKYATFYVGCPEFSLYLEKTCSKSMPRRRLVAMYLVVQLSKVIFPIAGKVVRTSCIYPTCKMAFEMRYTLAPALVNYLWTRLKMIGFLVRCAKAYNQNYGEHLLYAWFVYHCRGFHRLGEQGDLPFYRAVTDGNDMGLSLVAAARRVVANHRSQDICKRPVVIRDLQRTGLVSNQFPINQENSHTRILPLTTWEMEQLVSIRPSDLVFCREWLIDIQPNVLAQFSWQFGYSQGALGCPS